MKKEKTTKGKIKTTILVIGLYFVMVILTGLVLRLMINSIVSEKVIYLPVKECIVLRTQCNESGICGTLETYNCEDIRH